MEFHLSTEYLRKWPGARKGGVASLASWLTQICSVGLYQGSGTTTETLVVLLPCKSQGPRWTSTLLSPSCPWPDQEAFA